MPREEPKAGAHTNAHSEMNDREPEVILNMAIIITSYTIFSIEASVRALLWCLRRHNKQESQGASDAKGTD